MPESETARGTNVPRSSQLSHNEIPIKSLVMVLAVTGLISASVHADKPNAEPDAMPGLGGAGMAVIPASQSSPLLCPVGESDCGSGAGHGEKVMINVASGNLVVQHQDASLPSRGEDAVLIRTYNSLGSPGSNELNVGKRWSLSPFFELSEMGNKDPYFDLRTGDGSHYLFEFNDDRGLWESDDAEGAYLTLAVLDKPKKDGPAFVVTYADQSRLEFNKQGEAIRWEDANGNEKLLKYEAARLNEIVVDTGHIITFHYSDDVEGNRNLDSISDETEGTLVEYVHINNQLVNAMDRMGHATAYEYNADGLLSRITLPDSQETGNGPEHYSTREYQFDYQRMDWAGGQTWMLISVVNPSGGVTTFEYEALMTDGEFAGGHTTSTDAVGNVRVYSFDQDLNLTGLTDPMGFSASYQYDDRGNLVAVTDRNGWGVVHSDSDYFRMLRAELGATDGGGAGKLVDDLTDVEIGLLLEAYTSHFEYDGFGNLTRQEDNQGNATTLRYDEYNNLVARVLPLGNALAERNDPHYQQLRQDLGFGNLAENLTNAQKALLRARHTQRYTYDERQNVVSERSTLNFLTNHEYDDYGNRTKTTLVWKPDQDHDSPLQQITQFDHDEFGNVTEMTDAEGAMNSYEYDHFGNVTHSTDGNGGETVFQFDLDHRLLSSTDAQSHVTLNTYDAVGNLIGMTDAGGNTIEQSFDLNDRLTNRLNPADTNPANDRLDAFEYDAVGNVFKADDAEERETSYLFDANYRLLKVTTPETAGSDGSTLVQYETQHSYDAEDNVITTTNHRGYTTQYLYDPDGTMLQVTDPLGHVVRYFYDADGNQVSRTDGLQLAEPIRQVTWSRFDREDRRIETTDAEGNVESFVYDRAGNLIAHTDGNGHTTEFDYDRVNRLVQETFPEVYDPRADGGAGALVRHVREINYDDNGNVTERIDENGSSALFFHDKDNLLVLEEDANGIQTATVYDSRHNRTQRLEGVEASWDSDAREATVIDVADARNTTWRYNEFNELVAVVDGVGNALADSNKEIYGQLRQELGFSELAESLTNAQKALLRARHTSRFSYDRVGNQVTSRDNLNRLTEFAFDALNRRVSQTEAKNNTPERTSLFRFDGNGNLVGVTDAEGRESSYSYDENDRKVLQIDALGIESAWQYDEFSNEISSIRAFGDAVEERATYYAYDRNNFRISQTDPEGHVTLTGYDAVGNPIQTTRPLGDISETVFDARNRIVTEIEPLAMETHFEYDGAGNLINRTEPNLDITQYAYDAGNRMIELTDPAGEISTFAYDVLGNVDEEINAVGLPGQTVTFRVFDAVGNLRSEDVDGDLTTWSYDRVYNETEMTDPLDNTTEHSYDALNRLVLTIDPLGDETSYTYDSVDNLLTETDPLYLVTTYEYDDNNRRVLEIDPYGIETEFYYDVVGNLVQMIEQANTVTPQITSYVYNLDDLLVSETDPFGVTTIYVYNANHEQISP